MRGVEARLVDQSPVAGVLGQVGVEQQHAAGVQTLGSGVGALGASARLTRKGGGVTFDRLQVVVPRRPPRTPGPSRLGVEVGRVLFARR